MAGSKKDQQKSKGKRTGGDTGRWLKCDKSSPKPSAVRSAEQKRHTDVYHATGPATQEREKDPTKALKALEVDAQEGGRLEGKRGGTNAVMEGIERREKEVAQSTGTTAFADTEPGVSGNMEWS